MLYRHDDLDRASIALITRWLHRREGYFTQKCRAKNAAGEGWELAFSVG